MTSLFIQKYIVGKAVLPLGCICSRINSKIKINSQYILKILNFCVDALVSVTSALDNFHEKRYSSTLSVKKIKLSVTFEGRIWGLTCFLLALVKMLKLSLAFEYDNEPI